MKKIIDFHILSYTRFGGLHHITVAHHIIHGTFLSYNHYRNYCIKHGVSIVGEKQWEEAFPKEKFVTS
jgi:hypothetical protein